MNKNYCVNCKYSRSPYSGYCLSPGVHNESKYTRNKMSFMDDGVSDSNKENFNKNGDCQYYESSWWRRILDMFNKKEKGFTLIELLVVIAIVSILSTIVFVAVSNEKLRVACKEGDSIACEELNITEEEAKEQTIKIKKETNIEKARKVCPSGILEFDGYVDSTNGNFNVICK